jgi:hypothetical protein
MPQLRVLNVFASLARVLLTIAVGVARSLLRVLARLVTFFKTCTNNQRVYTLALTNASK